MRICVFLGASPGHLPVYREAAFEFGSLLARRGIGLVYGGGTVGLMGVVADAVTAAGGEAIGIIPQALRAREQDHAGLSELHVVATMHERKALMAKLSDGFVTLPGGIGTLEELFETWTWAQLGLHDKPCGLLDVNGYYQRLGGFVDHMVAEGFLQDHHRAMLMIDRDPEALLNRLLSFRSPETPVFIGPDDL